MKMHNTLDVTNRDDWRAWLEKHHDTEREAWLIYYKKHTGKPRIPYDDAVEEALCFGWIDSIVKRMDDEKYAQKFTPRKDKSKWSELNKRRAKKMIECGRMTEAGLAKVKNIDLNDAREAKPKPSRKELIIPHYIKEALEADGNVWRNFTNLAFSYKKQYIGWITNAKREETRKRRLKEAIDLLARNEKLGMK
jgi:uncharacterized protein YdeI (YjbR/CyaY-like superfamily)